MLQNNNKIIILLFMKKRKHCIYSQKNLILHNVYKITTNYSKYFYVPIQYVYFKIEVAVFLFYLIFYFM